MEQKLTARFISYGHPMVHLLIHATVKYVIKGTNMFFRLSVEILDGGL